MLPDMRRSDRFSLSEDMHALAALLDSDRCNTIRKMTKNTEFVLKTVFHTLKKFLGMRKIVSRWIIYDLTVMQKWLRYEQCS